MSTRKPKGADALNPKGAFPPAPSTEQQQATPTPAAQQQNPAPAVQPVDTSPQEEKKSFKRVPLNLDWDTYNRHEMARMQTMVATGHKSTVAYIRAALDAYTSQLEDQYNDGQPFG